MANWKLGKVQYSFLETATSGGTLTLIKSSKQVQILTGSSNHSVQLPDATTMPLGSGLLFSIVNKSTGFITIKLNDGSSFRVLTADKSIDLMLTDPSTSNGVWKDVSDRTMLMGAVIMTGSSAPWSTSSATFASFSAATGTSYALVGAALQPATNIPAIKFAYLPAGEYAIEYEGALQQDGSSAQAVFRFFDGTNATRERSAVQASTTNVSVPGMKQSIHYSTPQTNVTIEIQAFANGAGGTAFVYGDNTFSGTIRVYKI